MRDISIRPGDFGDAEAIADTLDGIEGPHLYCGSPQERREAIKAMLLKGFDQTKTQLLVAEIEGQVVGHAVWHVAPCLYLPGPEGYVSDFFVNESYRGMKVGSALMRALKDGAKQEGCFRLNLLTRKTRESYQRGFYAKQGFRERPGTANFVLELE